MKDKWDYKHVYPLTGGLNRSVPPEGLEDKEAVVAEGVFFERGLVRIDSGYRALGIGIQGYPQFTYEFIKKDGTTQIILVTTTRFYVFNTVSNEWDYVSDGISTTCNGVQVAGTSNILVASSTGFVTGDTVGVILDNGYQHKTTLSNVPDPTHVTLVLPIPVGRTAPASAAVVRSPILTGTIEFPITMVTFAAVDKAYMTNGCDYVKEFNGTTLINVSNLPSGGNTKCKTIAQFENYLLLINTTEGGVNYPQRVRRCDTGDPTNWTTGNAGYTNLYDTSGHLLAAVRLGVYMILYRSDGSIVRMEYVGSAETLFAFNTVVPTKAGIISTAGVAVVGDAHYVIGSRGFYKYIGGFEIEPIDSAVNELIFGTGGELNRTYLSRACAHYVDARDEVWFLIPTQVRTIPRVIYKYNVSKKTFTTRTFADDVIRISNFKQQVGTIWAQLSGTWESQLWRWGAQPLSTLYPSIVLCGYTDQKTFLYDYVSSDDDGTPIVFEFQSREFLDGADKVRTDYFDFYLSGACIIEISIDGGKSWLVLEDVNVGTEPIKYRISRQVVSNQFRLRLRGSGGGMVLSWYGFRLRKESEW